VVPEPGSSLRNLNEILAEKATLGQRAADAVASSMGSWTFIIVQTAVLGLWMTANVVAWVRHWDPYPFILMNLVLSTQAAYAAPIIMMSQNRQAARDRLEAHHDFLTNLKAEAEVRSIMEHLEAQDHMLREILVRLEAVQVEERQERRERAAGDPEPGGEPPLSRGASYP
jgi:uncharacterized membrane protein